MGLILGVYGIHSEAQVFAGSMAEVGSLAKDDLKAAIDVPSCAYGVSCYICM